MQRVCCNVQHNILIKRRITTQRFEHEHEMRFRAEFAKIVKNKVIEASVMPRRVLAQIKFSSDTTHRYFS
jgi:hypothetical protein